MPQLEPTLVDLAQPVLTAPAKVSLFLTVTVHDGHEQGVRDALTDVSGLVRSVAFREPEQGLTCVVGIGERLWCRLFPDKPHPEHLHEFEEVRGATHTAVATPGDLLFHIRSGRQDMCFELGRRLLDALGGALDTADGVHGFRYFDERDLLGFVDGTENPGGFAAVQAALVPDGDWAGASYVVVQQYLHDLEAWKAIGTEHQELAIGRSKLSDIEMADDKKPSNSHLTLNTIEDAEGNQLQIVRDNLPFGSVAERRYGTYFIAYAKDPGVTEEMLRRMFIGVPEGNHDRILDFSTPVTGCLFFCPPGAFLDDPDAVGDITHGSRASAQQPSM